MLKSSRGMDEPSTLRSGWYCCIRRDSSRWSSFSSRWRAGVTYRSLQVEVNITSSWEIFFLKLQSLPQHLAIFSVHHYRTLV